MVPRPPAANSDNRRLGTAALLIGFGLIVGAAWLAAASLRLRDAADFLLTVYLFSTGGVILIVLGLSPFALVTRGGVLVASAGAIAAAAVVWHLRGRPATPSLREAAAAAGRPSATRCSRCSPSRVALGLAYAAALAIATPTNDFDVLRYHLTRAAMWAPGARRPLHRPCADHPPERESAGRRDPLDVGDDTATAATGSPASSRSSPSSRRMLAITRIARLLGFSDREAAFGALLFATLPVVALQASLARNDVVMTSFVVVVVAFMLSDTVQPSGSAGSRSR